MRNLNEKEIEIISGGFGPPGAAIGATVGVATYLGHALTSGEGSFSGLAYAAITGAAVGFVSGPVGSFAEGAALAGVGSYTGFIAGTATGALAKAPS